MSSEELAKDSIQEDEEFLELMKLFLEVEMSDPDKVQPAVAEEDSEKGDMSSIFLRPVLPSFGLLALFMGSRRILEWLKTRL